LDIKGLSLDQLHHAYKKLGLILEMVLNHEGLDHAHHNKLGLAPHNKLGLAPFDPERLNPDY
jgi:hypothetical protein